MTVHKLTAGDGYAYLTRQVAAHDATDRGSSSLGDYYSEKGEAPGVWMGRGLAGVPDFPVGAQVTEAQMVALFGQGRHPNAEQIERAARLAGQDFQQTDRASRLGSPYLVFEQANEFRRRCAEEFRDYNTARGLAAVTPVPQEDRARIRTAVATAMFAESYGRPPADARELSGHLARISRQTTTAVAGYDLIFSPVKSVSTLWAIAGRARTGMRWTGACRCDGGPGEGPGSSRGHGLVPNAVAGAVTAGHRRPIAARETPPAVVRPSSAHSSSSPRWMASQAAVGQLVDLDAGGTPWDRPMLGTQL